LIKRKTKFEPAGYKTVVKRSSAGLGLYAAEEIPKGICIIEYLGRVISPEEEYTINSKYLFEVTSKMTIDGKPKSNKAGYINHSCRPNAEPEVRKHRIFIMSKRKIRAGEEICYDYGKEYWNEYIKPRGCRCEKCIEKGRLTMSL
jgi:SET domain-containing protein